jgi:hypothetical protein
MADFETELESFNRVLDSLNDIERQLDPGEPVVVGTAVNYSVFLEFGTSDMDPKPFFRPALAELRVKGVQGFIESSGILRAGKEFSDVDDAGEVVDALALTLERRIKQIITEKSLIDTGTLRASIVAVSGTAANLPEESEFSGFTSDSPAPQTAGRALANAVVEVDI